MIIWSCSVMILTSRIVVYQLGDGNLEMCCYFSSIRWILCSNGFLPDFI